MGSTRPSGEICTPRSSSRLRISRIEAKAKLSQNRPAADVEGVVAGLEASGDVIGAGAVREANDVARSRR